MAEADIEEVYALQAASYPPNYVESRASLLARLARHRGGCLVWEEGGRGGRRRIVGYIIFHPFPLGRCAALDPAEEGAPGAEDCLYIHDLVVGREWRGRGVARALFARAERAAAEAGLGAIALVAVSGAERFWAGLGFETIREVLYGGLPAVYMVRRGGREGGLTIHHIFIQS